jgi:hypothetical protein
MFYMKWIYALLALLLIVGCASVKTAPQATPKIDAKAPETISQPTADKSGSSEIGKLPKSYMPEAQNINNARRVAAAFREVQSLKMAKSINFLIFRDINAKGYSSAMLTRCDFDIIKAFVAYGWAPAVILRSPTGLEHLRTVIGYNDPPEELTLVDPMETIGPPEPGALKQMKLSYTDFTKMWNDQQKSCLLLFSQYTDESLIKNALWQFLPKDKTNSIVIRTKVNAQ